MVGGGVGWSRAGLWDISRSHRLGLGGLGSVSGWVVPSRGWCPVSSEFRGTDAMGGRVGNVVLPTGLGRHPDTGP